jgi:predicted ATPase/DNA-binding CsgD family transcriptional regulator
MADEASTSQGVRVAVTAVASRLPAEMSSFIGRSSLIDEVTRSLQTRRLATLTGPGGVGKTRLLIHLGRQLESTEPFRNDVVLVELAGLQAADDDRLVSRIADELGIRRNAGRSPLAQVLEYFQSDLAADGPDPARHRQPLLLLDNCEQLIDTPRGTGPVPGLVRTLLKGSPNLRVIATSRSKIGLPGERVIAVPPLQVGRADSYQAGDVNNEKFEALRLLLERAADVGRRIPERDYPLAIELCHMLDGIPHALETAAARMDTHTLREVVEHPDLLRHLQDPTTDQENHRSLYASMKWTYDLLDEPTQRMWALCSVFPETFDRQATEAICQDNTIGHAAVHDLLSTLVHLHVLKAEEKHGRTRYRMFETNRQFGRQLVRAAGDDRWLQQAHADYYRAMTARACLGWLSRDQLTWMWRMPIEQPNTIAAQEFLGANLETAAAGLELAINETRTYAHVFNGTLSESPKRIKHGLAQLRARRAEALLDDGAEVSSADTRMLEATALSVGAFVATIQGTGDLGEQLLREAESIAEELGCADTFPPVLNSRGTRLWLTEPRLDRARESLQLLRRAEEALAADGGEDVDWFMVLLFLAMATGFLGDEETAYAEAERVLAAARKAEAPWCVSWALWTNALVELRHGLDLHRPYELAQEALRIQLDCGDTWGPVWSVWILAIILAHLGEHEAAAKAQGGSIRLQHDAQANVLGLLSFLRLENDAKLILGSHFKDEKKYKALQKEGKGLSKEKLYDLVLKSLAPQPAPGAAAPAAEKFPGGLTRSQWNIACLLGDALDSPTIATRLRISTRTVEGHILAAYNKLGFNTRLELGQWAEMQKRSRQDEQPGG